MFQVSNKTFSDHFRDQAKFVEKFPDRRKMPDCEEAIRRLEAAISGGVVSLEDIRGCRFDHLYSILLGLDWGFDRVPYGVDPRSIETLKSWVANGCGSVAGVAGMTPRPPQPAATETPPAESREPKASDIPRYRVLAARANLALRLAEPAFRASQAIYVLVAGEDPLPDYLVGPMNKPQHKRSVVGFTSSVCDLVASEHLAEQGAWQGRGFCCVVASPSSMADESAWVGVVIHEAAHYLDNLRTLEGWTAATSPDVDEALAASNVKGTLRELFTFSTGGTMFSAHPASFFRAAGHLVHRVNQGLSQSLLPQLAPDAAVNSSEFRGPPAGQVMEALGDELESRGEESIVDIIRSPFPQRFAEMWKAGTGERLQ